MFVKVIDIGLTCESATVVNNDINENIIVGLINWKNKFDFIGDKTH